MKISRDGGYHWLEQVDVVHDPTGRVFYWDARYNVGDGGHVVAAFWAYDRKQQRDLNIHFSDTRDGGRTWCPPRDCGLVGQVCQPVLVGGDRLLLVYVDRFGTRAIRAALSHDLGRSFVEDMPIYRHPAAEQEQGSGATSANYLQDMELWTFGRTDAFRAPTRRYGLFTTPATPSQPTFGGPGWKCKGRVSGLGLGVRCPPQARTSEICPRPAIKERP